jgi:hypothetical protein
VGAKGKKKKKTAPASEQPRAPWGREGKTWEIVQLEEKMGERKIVYRRRVSGT